MKRDPKSKRSKINQETLKGLWLTKQVIEHSPVVLLCCKNQPGWPIEFVSENVRQFGYEAQELIQNRVDFLSLVFPEDQRKMSEEVLTDYQVPAFCREYRLLDYTGHCRWVEDHFAAVRNGNGEVTHFQGIVLDIHERKLAEDRLRFLSLHDSLTGFYNRTYFEEEMRRLESGRFNPVGMIMCDVDGLKLINDTLGHSAGDRILAEAAALIRKCFRDSDTLARVGGDEFAILLPHTPGKILTDAYYRIRDAIDEYNRANPPTPLSISLGCAVREDNKMGMGELFKEADNNMYREKLLRRQSARQAIVQTLMHSLETKEMVGEDYLSRLDYLMGAMAEVLGFAAYKIQEMKQFAKYHDIGMVGVSDNILYKVGPLNIEEYAEIKRHCEVGQRIALAAPDLSDIADLILKHHEWWNGQGYPLGLQGEEIPIECRILSVAEAYLAMTRNLRYRTAMSHEDALMELRRCSGSQFDPDLVDIFGQIFDQRTGLQIRLFG